MFHTLSQVSPNQSLDYDLCIIGAGAAGITIANKLKDAGLNICLLEGGGLDGGSESQALYQGASHGYVDLLACRLRFFGGTTNHWTGYCRAPDEQDLKPRPWDPSSGWPLSLAELNRYLPEAMDIVEIPNQFDPAYWAKKKGVIPLTLKSTEFREGVSLVGPPVRFNEKYRSAIDRSRSVTCLLDANVVELLPSNHYSTTKMHTNPKQGVVDTDCRVHGIHNLFVAGSSVFPTAGLITPTMTIVALALRLADKLKGAVNA